MTTTPETPAAGNRADLVRRDLDNVIHPIVPHKQLEERQLVIASAKDSTVVDADGREYLDGMAGLWCVNIGYGRTELAEVASQQMQKLSYYPHTAMNAPAAALAEKVNGLLGGDNHVYLVSSGSEANEAAIKFARQYAVHESPGPAALQVHQPLLRLSRHDAGHAGRGRHGRSEDEVRAAVRQRVRPRRAAVLLPLPLRPRPG